MLGFGGRFYWGRGDRERKQGIVVVFAWMCSDVRHLKHYIQLYSSSGWDSLVCHSGCFNMFVPAMATSAAIRVIDELIRELKIKPCPVVFASFSGGPKACMYKILQRCEGDEDGILRRCITGFIYDSSPIDFYSELAFKFFLHPSVIKRTQPPRWVSWAADRIRVSLDGFFLTWSESQRAEYWQTLYASARIGGPYLILCSENDELADYKTILNFAHRLEELGASVHLLKWDVSPHVGHYRAHPAEYRFAVARLLENSALVYSERFGEELGEVTRASEIPGCSGFLLNDFVEYHLDEDGGDMEDHGSAMKNVKGCDDAELSSSSNGGQYGRGGNLSLPHLTKILRHSRL